MEDAFRDPGLKLIETLRWDGANLVRLDRHLARARASAAALGFAWSEAAVTAALARVTPGAQTRLRLTVGRDGAAEVTETALARSPAHWRLQLATDRLDPADPRLAHKTTDRARYDRARAGLPPDIDEIIFANTRGDVCEGAISTVFFDRGDGLRTPPLSCGCLPGVLRGELLDRGLCQEGRLTIAELPLVRLWVGNSLRGLVPATLAG